MRQSENIRGGFVYFFLSRNENEILQNNLFDRQRTKNSQTHTRATRIRMCQCAEPCFSSISMLAFALAILVGFPSPWRFDTDENIVRHIDSRSHEGSDSIFFFSFVMKFAVGNGNDWVDGLRGLGSWRTCAPTFECASESAALSLSSSVIAVALVVQFVDGDGFFFLLSFAVLFITSDVFLPIHRRKKREIRQSTLGHLLHVNAAEQQKVCENRVIFLFIFPKIKNMIWIKIEIIFAENGRQRKETKWYRFQ